MSISVKVAGAPPRGLQQLWVAKPRWPRQKTAEQSIMPSKQGLKSLLPVLCLVCRIYNSGTLPCQFLGDVVYWTMAAKRDGREADGTTTGAAAAAVPALPATSGSKKKTRKLQQQQHLSVTQQRSPLLQAGHLYPKLLLLLEFTEELDQMVSGNDDTGIRGHLR